MNSREARRFATRQILELDHLRALSAGHPLMEPQLEQRVEDLRREIEALPSVGPEARTVLFFGGGPVQGSAGIDAQFVSAVLNPFLEMVKSQYAAAKHGRVGERGPRRDEDEARLMLTATPRGSFGLELSHPYADDLFAEERLSAVLAQLTRVIEATSESDEGFLLSLDEISSRTYIRLPDFFRVLRDGDADLRMQTGDIEVELNRERVNHAFQRVSSSRTVERQIHAAGVFRGATLDTWRFDFRMDEGEAISGKISGDLGEDAVASMLAYANQRSIADLNETTVITSGGAMRRRYTLLGLTQPVSNSSQ